MKTRAATSLILLLVGAGLMGCAGTLPPPPAPIDDQSAGLGLSLKMRQGPLKLTSATPDIVLFAPLAEGETVADVVGKQTLIPSTFADGEQIYLLNLEPGTYAAVAAVYGVEQEPTEITFASTNIGSNVSVSFGAEYFGEETYRNYFSEDLVARTMTTIEPGTFVYMGRYITNQSTTLGNCDPTQDYVMHFVEGDQADRGGFVKFMSGDFSRRLDLHEFDGGAKQQGEFRKKADKYFAGTAWAGMIVIP